MRAPARLRERNGRRAAFGSIVAAVTENDLLRALAAAVAEGRVTAALDCRRLLHTDSPIAVQADHNRWLYGIALAAGGAALALGWRIGLAALAAGVGLYFAVGRPWIHRRMRARFSEKTLTDIADFKRLWQLKGVTLTLAAGGVSCASPGGDWRRFVMDRVLPHV